MGREKEKNSLHKKFVKQLNTYGNGIGVLVTREAKSIGLKSGDKVEVTATTLNKKEVIIIEKVKA